ncbi:hypothetical protein ABCS02_15870 [Microbacterium sp. X-17]|uniref:hypothetical protein n=1 Tax=Microbacterium sp. X-17 TaxID=3144404 RepID=UPI0031F561FB
MPASAHRLHAVLRRGRVLVFLLVGYLAIPLLNAVSPLLAIPAITAAYGEGAFAAVAIGQSLGATAGVVVELGWSLSGTQRVARQSPRNRARSLALSLVTKLMAAVPFTTIAGIVAFLLAREHAEVAALVAVATSLGTLSAGWIYLGMMRPRTFLMAEAIPRAVIISLAAVGLHLGAPLLLYPIALLGASLVGPALGCLVLGVRARDFLAVSPRRCLIVIRCQLHALTTGIFSSVYISLGVTVATLGSPHATVLYGSVDRLQQMAQQVLKAVHTLFKGWVGRAVEPALRVARARTAVVAAAVVGALGGIVFAVLAPFAADLLFSGTVTIPPAAAIISGVSLWIITLSMAMGGIMLVTLNRIAAVARSAIVGAVVGVPLIYGGAVLGGGTGALAGQLAAELAVASFQAVAVFRGLRTLRMREASRSTLASKQVSL